MPARRPARFRLLLLLPALAAGCAVVPECGPGQGDVVPVTLDRGLPVVPARFNGQDARLLLDTGAAGLFLTAPGAARLQLPAVPGMFAQARGSAGEVRASVVAVARFEFASLRRDALSLPALPVPLMENVFEAPVDGFLGVDGLGPGAVELDFSQRRAVLFPADRCRLERPAWEGGATQLPSWQSANGRLGVRVLLNGQSLPALLDTGAQRTRISRRAASLLGVPLPPATARPSRVVGIGDTPPNSYGFRFRELRIGDEVLRGPVLSIVDGLPQAAEMVIGADLLNGRRVLLSYATGQVFMQPPRTKPVPPTAVPVPPAASGH
ncbi:retroviral-like aspartic protease family protein [Roseomonas sp. BN140053]|uniref:retroviral-like aspartic protease family protein n=1 Tax=Roseomonas sp. BN140053 TaxID=3391898 RepID=UPI0039E90A17